MEIVYESICDEFLYFFKYYQIIKLNYYYDESLHE